MSSFIFLLALVAVLFSIDFIFGVSGVSNLKHWIVRSNLNPCPIRMFEYEQKKDKKTHTHVQNDWRSKRMKIKGKKAQTFCSVCVWRSIERINERPNEYEQNASRKKRTKERKKRSIFISHCVIILYKTKWHSNGI